MTKPNIDPIVLEMLWRRLDSTVDELSATLVRTSFSTVVRDVNDYACAVFDERARLLAQSRDSTPGLCGPLGTMLRHMIDVIPPDQLEEGDVLIGNDPWNGSGHHNDITVTTPAYHEGRIIGYVVTCCHHADIGGRRATTESRDNYEEGLRIPVSKVFRRGEINHDVMNFIRSNVRSSDIVVGDLRAQFAANHVGCRRIAAICGEQRWAGLEPLADEMIVRSRELAVAEIRKIPNGTYCHEAFVDATDEADIFLKVAVHVRDDEIEVDYSGSSAQVRTAINCTLTYSTSYSVFALNCLLALPVSMNEGTLSPLKVTAPPGSIVNATFPAPVFARTTTGNFLPEIIMMALAKAMPDRVIGGAGAAPLWAQYMFGRRADGSEFSCMNAANGGFGARAGMDGVSCLPFPFNVGNTPVETLESEVPVLCRSRALRVDSEGPGRFRGGFGQEFSLEVLDGDLGPRGSILISFRGGRFVHPVPGILDGESGGHGKLQVNDVPVAAGKAMTVSAGDVIVCRIPGGGGYGDPGTRDRALVARDLAAGLISPQRARDVYGYDPVAAAAE